MARKAVKIVLSNEEKSKLQKYANGKATEHRMVVRAKIVLMAANGTETIRIAKQLDISPKMVCKWRIQYSKYGIEGLSDAKRPGRPWKFGPEDRLKVITTACQKPEAITHWSIRELQKNVPNNMSRATIHRILKKTDLKPHQYKMWLNSNDPEFEAKQTEITGLYMNPPENALVICVDERTGMQALGRKIPNKPMRPGQPEKMEFEYVRHGTKSLIAAFVAHEGKVTGKCYDRHRHEEFIDFLEEIEKEYPQKELHIIVDNLSVHKHKDVNKWLEKRNGRIKFHFTPTHASWLNQIELWFSILSRKLLKRGIFNSREDLVAQVMKFIEKYNKEAKPFRWTYTGEPLKI